VGAVRADAHDRGVYHLCLQGKATKGHSADWKFLCRLSYGWFFRGEIIKGRGKPWRSAP